MSFLYYKSVHSVCLMLLWSIVHLTMFARGEIITINTNLGHLDGIKEDIEGVGSIFQFLNVPYASPPVGEKRFTKSEPYGTWTGNLNATSYGPSCMQDLYLFPFPFLPNMIMNEDCLYLNVFAPFDTNSTSNRSVMVWIHGGGFIAGQGMAYDPTNIALVGNVIVVTINYRLGVFGFFYTGDPNAPGNYGLWDQKLALEWVNENIEWFGGNKNSVTIFGESAGAISVSLLSINPQTKGLFQRTIAQSGDALLTDGIIKPSQLKESSISFANRHGCAPDPQNTTEIVKCMKNLPANEILTLANTWPWFTPTIDGDIVEDDPLKLLQNTTSESYAFFRSLDIISGTNDADGSLFVHYIPSANLSLEDGITSEYFCDVLVPLFVIERLPTYSSFKSAICQKYSNTTSVAGQGKMFVDLLSDVTFLIPSVQSLNVHAFGEPTGKTFQYLFTHTNHIVKTFLPRYKWVTGAGHGDELIFLFGMEDAANKYNFTVSASDTLLIKQLTEYWTNFAKTGDPNGDNLPVWPRYDQSEEKYLRIGSVPSQDSGVFADRVRLLMQAIPTPKPTTMGPISVAPSNYNIQISIIAFVLTVCLFSIV